MNIETLLILAKYLAISLVLFLTYLLLLKGRVSYSRQRKFLLLIPLMSALASVVTFDFVVRVDQSSLLGGVVQIEQRMLESYAFTDFEIIRGDGATLLWLDDISWWFVAWGVVAAYLLVRYLFAMSRILNLRAASKRERCGRYAVYRSELVESPFSFMRSIYIDPKIEGEKLDIVLRHEEAHISKCHYVDKLLSEAMIVVSWFNPVVWIIRKELCVVHEFEADRVVLSGYSDIKRYKQFLFDEVVISIPYVANGFNSSLIKKRFLEMKNSNKNHRGTLRMVLATLAVAVVLTAASLTYVLGQDNVTKVSAIKVDSNSRFSNLEERLKGGDMVYITFKDGTKQTFVGEGIEKVHDIDPETIESIAVTKSPASDLILAQESAPKSEKTKSAEKPTFYKVSRDQYMVTEGAFKGYNKNNNNHAVYRCDGYTEVDLITTVPHGANNWWVGFSSEIYLVDRKSGDRYKIHSIKRGIPLNQYMWIKNQAGYNAVFTLIFPPLKKGVTKVDVVEYVIEGPRPASNDGKSVWVTRDVPVRSVKDRNYRDIGIGNDGELVTLDPDFKVE